MEGGGSLSNVEGSTDPEGQASAHWTLGPADGEQRITAAASPAIVATLASIATPMADGPTIQGISPSLLIEGETGTITGTGLADAAVTVDSRPAQVLLSSSGALTFEVPAGDCLPARPLEIQVSQGGNEATAAAVVGPANRLEPLDFGAIWMSFGTGPKGHCLHLEPRTSPATYLIGVQSLSQVVSSLTPSTLEISSSSAMPAALASNKPTATGLETKAAEGLGYRGLDVTAAPALLPSDQPVLDRRLALLSAEEVAAAHDHSEKMARNLDLLEALGPPALPLGNEPVSAATALQSVGEQVNFRIPETCEAYSSATGTVRAVGSQAIWIEDNARPSGGLSASQYSQLATMYDDLIGPELARLVGSPSDLDGNGRVVIVLSPRVNDLQSVNGFMFTGDFFPPSNCSSSNHGEYFYMVVPDPNGATGRQLSVSDALDLYPRLLAHELTHVIHFGKQLFSVGGSTLPEVWEMEGLATFLEELVGHAATGNSSGQELGSSAVQDHPQWYRSMFQDLALYSGFESATTRIAEAPHECSWLARPPNGPCVGDVRMPYGVPASIFRWIADFAWTPQTEHNMTRAVASATTHGLPLLSELASEDLQWVFALWAIAIVADGHYFGGGDAAFASWNFHSVFSGFHATARPTPKPASYNSFHAFNLRGGSMAYFLVEGSHEEIAVAARNLPSHVRLWMARVK